MDFIKRHPCKAVSIAGILLIAADFFSETLAAYGFGIFLVFWFTLAVSGVILLGINIVSMTMTSNDKPVAAVILSLIFGGLGAFIGLQFNPGFKYERAVKIIFTVQTWLVAWVFFSFMLYAADYYSFSLAIPG